MKLSNIFCWKVLMVLLIVVLCAMWLQEVFKILLLEVSFAFSKFDLGDGDGFSLLSHGTDIILIMLIKRLLLHCTSFFYAISLVLFTALTKSERYFETSFSMFHWIARFCELNEAFHSISIDASIFNFFFGHAQ